MCEEFLCDNCTSAQRKLKMFASHSIATLPHGPAPPVSRDWKIPISASAGKPPRPHPPTASRRVPTLPRCEEMRDSERGARSVDEVECQDRYDPCSDEKMMSNNKSSSDKSLLQSISQSSSQLLVAPDLPSLQEWITASEQSGVGKSGSQWPDGSETRRGNLTFISVNERVTEKNERSHKCCGSSTASERAAEKSFFADLSTSSSLLKVWQGVTEIQFEISRYPKISDIFAKELRFNGGGAQLCSQLPT
jgi:hypothetical protein